MAVFKDAPSFGPGPSLEQRMKKADAWIKLTPEEKTAAVKKKYSTLTPKQRDLLNKQQFFLTEVVPLLIPGAVGVKFAAKLGSRMLPGIQKFFNFATKRKPPPKLPPLGRRMYKPPEPPKPSNVVKLPKSEKKINVEELLKTTYRMSRLKKDDPDISDTDLKIYEDFISSLNRPLTDAEKHRRAVKRQQMPEAVRTGKVYDFKTGKPKKARGGKLKKRYARGGGIRKPKGY